MPRAESFRARCGSLDAGTRQLAELAIRDLPVGDLIAEAVAVGLRLWADGDRLRIRGPHGMEGIAWLLLERKAEVLAALRLRSERMMEDATGLALPAACGTAPVADTPSWDAERAAAIVTEVDALIDEALKAVLIADNPARQNVLTNERVIVGRLARECDPFLAAWPQALRDLLARWAAWNKGRGKG